MSNRKYAEGTRVSASRSLDELRVLLRARGAGRVVIDDNPDEGHVAVLFQRAERAYRISVPIPSTKDRAFTHTPELGRQRDPAGRAKAYNDEIMRRHRSLLMHVKAKLIAVDDGIVTFEREFMVHLVMPTGDTLGEFMEPRIADAVAMGQLPSLAKKALLLPSPEAS